MGVKRGLSLILQLDESCVSQHINERRVRTLEEEDEATSSLGTAASPEMDTASANNDECDLEELERLENDGKDLEDSGDDDDDDDDDGTGKSQSDTVFSSDVASADVVNSRSVGNSGADISEDVASSGMQADEQQSSDEDIFQDAVSSEMPIGRTSSSADSEAIADVNTVRNESTTRSATEEEEVDTEFPDTTIELQHISGSKFVFASSVNSTLRYYYK